MPARISFFLMTRKGLNVLQDVIETIGPESVACVVGSRDAALQEDCYEDIAALCSQHSIPFFDRKSDYAIGTEYAISIAWRWLINLSGTRLIVLHDSLLPRYRGFAPLVNAMINGEAETGVTAIFSSKEYDQGDVVAQGTVKISYPLRIREAIEMVSTLYSQLVIEILKKIRAGDALVPVPQDETQASYSLWRDDEDYNIDWHKDAASIRRFVDAVGFPYRGARTLNGNVSCRVLEGVVVPDVRIENRTPGKIIFVEDGYPVVVCGKGLFKIILMTDEEGNSLLPINKFRIRFHS